MKCSFTVTIFK